MRVRKTVSITIGTVAKVHTSYEIGSDCITIAVDCCTRAQRGDDDVAAAAAPLGFGTTQQYGPVRFCRRRSRLSRAQQPEKLRFPPVIRSRTREDEPSPSSRRLLDEIRRPMRILLFVRCPREVEEKPKRSENQNT